MLAIVNGNSEWEWKVVYQTLSFPLQFFRKCPSTKPDWGFQLQAKISEG